MVWIIYNILFVVGFTILLPRFLLRMFKRGGYSANFAQRFGVYRPSLLKKLQDGRLWIHAVSVGETYVALQVMIELRTHRPDIKFVLSVTTSTGHQIALTCLDERDVLIYFPVDFPWVTARVLRQWNPLVFVLVEGELWPNLIRALHRRSIPVYLVNGRLSDSSFRGYQMVKPISRRILPMFHRLYVQSEQDRDRFEVLGAKKDRVTVMGSAKYDVALLGKTKTIHVEEIMALAGIGDEHTVVMGGSTWPGEEKALLQTYIKLKNNHPELVLMLAPRHAERSNEVVKEIQELGLSIIRRSSLSDGNEHETLSRPDVFLLDTTGELKDFYSAADIIFVGKSLTNIGGQNVLEPALFEKAIIVGPHMENFPVESNDFSTAEAWIRVEDEGQLCDRIGELIEDEPMRDRIGKRAARVVHDKSGAIRFAVRELAAESLSSGRASPG